MKRAVYCTAQVRQRLEQLRDARGQQRSYKAIATAIRLLGEDPHGPDLVVGELTCVRGPRGERVFSSCASGVAQSTYRVLWHHGPKDGQVTLLAIAPDP